VSDDPTQTSTALTADRHISRASGALSAHMRTVHTHTHTHTQRGRATTSTVSAAARRSVTGSTPNAAALVRVNIFSTSNVSMLCANVVLSVLVPYCPA